MAEDPTVYQYDEVYEQMEEKKQEENAAKNADKATKKPRYIQNMIKNAERQKRENERRIERQVQKDREAEGEQFADKEKFVTSAYRKKMEENAKLDEEEERMDRIEKALDVKGQKDMSGFYRHLYRQTMGEEKGQKSTGADEVLSIDAPKDKAEIKKVSSDSLLDVDCSFSLSLSRVSSLFRYSLFFDETFLISALSLGASICNTSSAPVDFCPFSSPIVCL